MQSSEAIGAAREDARPAETLGARLRRAREAQGLSLEAVSAELRISVPALTALEECRFEALGPPVFAKGYLKQYGARLGLDVAELVADYRRMAGDTSVEIEPSKSIRLRDERQILVWIVGGLAFALAIAILATWWWLGRSGTLDAAAESAAPGAIVPEPEAVPEPAAGVDARPAPGPRADALAEPALSTDTSTRQGANAPTANEPNANEASANEANPNEPVAPADPPEPYTGPALEVVFVEDSWAEITGDGERLYYALGLAGTRAIIPADRDLNLFFGNAAGVELRLDGEPVPIPARARRGDLAQFDLEARTGQAP